MSDGEPGATRLAAMAKRFATDIGFEAVNGCLQLHGGYGYLRDHPIERVMRDVRVHQILEGTNEVMRLIVSRDSAGETELSTHATTSCSSAAAPPGSSRSIARRR